MTETEKLKTEYLNSKEKAQKFLKSYKKHLEFRHQISDLSKIIKGHNGVCYVSHPYGGKAENIEKSGEICRYIQDQIKENGTVLSPIHNFNYLTYHENTNEYWEDMLHCIQLLDVCDYLIMSENWTESLGCCVEFMYAVKHYKDIYFYHEEEI